MTADEWNRLHPPGTLVTFWPGVREGEGIAGVTCSRAWETGSGDAIVSCTGRAGGIALTHVEPRRGD